jgi:hypothetical protein
VEGLGLDWLGLGGPAGPKKGFGLFNWLDRPSKRLIVIFIHFGFEKNIIIINTIKE